MSWVAVRWAKTQKTGSASAKAILFVLANYADEKGFCFPSQETIAKATELSLDTVQRQMRKLEKGDFLSRISRKRAGGRWPSHGYQLNLNRVSIGGPHASCSPTSVTVPTNQAATDTASEPQRTPAPDRTTRPDSLRESSVDSSKGLVAEANGGLGIFGLRIKQKVGEAVYYSWFRFVGLVEATPEKITLLADIELATDRTGLTRKRMQLAKAQIEQQY